MMSPAPAAFRVFACRQGSTMVGYSSLALLVAIAAITLLGHPGIEAGVSRPPAIGGISSSD